MSTDHQQYSTQNQQKAIREFAGKRGMTVVRSFIDAGRSGLHIDGRDALKQLIQGVEAGQANFSAILVYDVSRWGRFQDADESAYYEYICRRANVAVHYCAEQFENDGSQVSTIIKSVKRVMAGEYSRELSAKVFKGQCRLIELGYRQGGAAGFGLRRMLLDANGNCKGILNRGEWKNLQTDRVILVPGPLDEVETIREIFRAFVEDGKSIFQIAKSLNEKGIPTDRGRRWHKQLVENLLTNEKYIGNNVFNRVSMKLRGKPVTNPREMWIRRDSAFEAIVEPNLFNKAQTIIRERSRKKFTNEEVLAGLGRLMQREGKLSRQLIEECHELPAVEVLIKRFGSLKRIYELAGGIPTRKFIFYEITQRLKLMRAAIVEEIIARIRERGGIVEHDPSSDFLTVNSEFTAFVFIARCTRRSHWPCCWLIKLHRPAPDIAVVARMDRENQAVTDYYLVPKLAPARKELVLTEKNFKGLQGYRFANLDLLYDLARRARLSEEA